MIMHIHLDLRRLLVVQLNPKLQLSSLLMKVLCSIVFCVIASIIFLLAILPVRIGWYIGILLMLIADEHKINIMKSMDNYISLKFDLYPKNIYETSIEYALWRCFYILQQVFSSFVSNEGYQVHKIVWWIIFRKSHATGPSMLQITANCPYERLINFVTGKQKMIPFLAMGLLPDTQNCGLRMRRECRERFPRRRRLAMPTCIRARASRTCRDACRDR